MTSENIPASEPKPLKTLAEFLESTPPGVTEEVSDAIIDHQKGEFLPATFGAFELKIQLLLEVAAGT